MKRILLFSLCAALLLTLLTSCLPLSGNGGKTAEGTAAETAETPLVADAVNYEKEPVPVYDWIEVTWMHKVIIPRLTIETDTAAAINKKIYEKYAPIKTKLENNEEAEELYDISYRVFRKDDVVAILITALTGVQASEAWASFDVYYYNVAADRELDAAGYYAALGVTLNSLDQRIRATDAFREYTADHVEQIGPFGGWILWCVFDDAGFFSLYHDPDGLFSENAEIGGNW